MVNGTADVRGEGSDGERGAHDARADEEQPPYADIRIVDTHEEARRHRALDVTEDAVVVERAALESELDRLAPSRVNGAAQVEGGTRRGAHGT
jgi:hypothetical protein